MEKPRKIDIPDKPLIPKLAFDAHPIIEAMGYNKGLDAMSTWLEGEVPTIEEMTKHTIDYFKLNKMEYDSYQASKYIEAIRNLLLGDK